VVETAVRPLPAGPPPSPPARRLGPPRWRDTRLVAGVLLLLLAVVVGARVLQTSDTTTPVVSVTVDLPAGHVLTDTDLGSTRVRLTGAARGRYAAVGQRAGLVGRVLARGLTAGELLPVSAVAVPAATPARLVPVRVADGRYPGLAEGDHVDVYATFARDGAAPTGSSPAAAPAAAPTAAGSGAAAPACVTTAVVSDVEVAAPVDPPGGESGGAAITLLLRVPPGQAATLVLASETGRLDVVRHLPSGDDQGATPADPLGSLGGLVPTGCGDR